MQPVLKFKIPDEELVIQIIRSKRRTVSFEVGEDLLPILRVPKKMSDGSIGYFCDEHKKAIIRCYQRAKKKFPEPMSTEDGWRKIYRDGNRLPLGNQTILLHIELIEQIKAEIQLKEVDRQRCLYIKIPADAGISCCRNCVAGWYKDYAKVKLFMKAQYYAKQMGVSFSKITIREQKTRWGSCSSKGNLNFNWKIMLLPEFMQDYIVIHELAHRIVMNHSASFWEEVEKICPDYRTRVVWQKENEGSFIKF